MATQSAAIGFAPHSGWAAMIALGINRTGPCVLARSRVLLIDDHDPDSKQPYHSVELLCVEEATGRLTGYLDVARAMAYAAIKTQAEELKSQGYGVRRAGILESAGRKPSSLASILASHALIHAADGDHFRNALWAAAGQYGLEVHRIQARTLEEHAMARLHLPKQRMLDTVNQLGRQVGPPWGADQKKAALLAWSLLKPERS
ncbi:MAG TPA: hypothetical protein VGI65_15315 [Steroidobacteraceae bacterium]|jgi:hypothetical protein